MPDTLDRSFDRLYVRGSQSTIKAITAIFANWGPEQQSAVDTPFDERETLERRYVSKLASMFDDLSLRDFTPETQLQIAKHAPSLFNRLVPEENQWPRTHKISKRAIREWLTYVRRVGRGRMDRYKISIIPDILNEHND